MFCGIITAYSHLQMNAVDKNSDNLVAALHKKSVLQSCMQLLITAGKLQRQEVAQPV